MRNHRDIQISDELLLGQQQLRPWASQQLSPALGTRNMDYMERPPQCQPSVVRAATGTRGPRSRRREPDPLYSNTVCHPSAYCHPNAKGQPHRLDWFQSLRQRRLPALVHE